jgi:hypothetical protein
MKSNGLVWAATLVAVLGASIGALAQSQQHKIFTGVIDAYTPQSSTGPYEIHGPWTLDARLDAPKADFSAALNMELSDGWVITKNNGQFEPHSRDVHTHHITFVGGDITRTANGFQVAGMATITRNGDPAPVSPAPLTVEITGGIDVGFSNITLTFGTPGSKHFGPEPLPGVVENVKEVAE